MATDEAYMLSRDQDESRRLDAQHHFCRALAYGHLVQPSIPKSGLRDVADVGCGTGIWLREAAQELAARNDLVKFTGFDISAQQFPKDSIHGVDFVVHDAVEPFPLRYHEKFDLVQVRLLSYALKAKDLQNAVENIISLLRPGGHLQWQEFDALDSWAVPETLNARSSIAHVISERMARGLTPAIASPLVKAIQSIQTPIPKGLVNPVSWVGDTVRIMHLETISTMNHPSSAVEAGKKQLVLGVAAQLLQAAISRRQTLLLANKQLSDSDTQRLEAEVGELNRLVDAWQRGGDPASSRWDLAMTSIIARKARLVDEREAWMTPKY